MKNSGVCPKCGGTEILRIDGRSVIGGVIPAGWTGAMQGSYISNKIETIIGLSVSCLRQKRSVDMSRQRRH